MTREQQAAERLSQWAKSEGRVRTHFNPRDRPIIDPWSGKEITPTEIRRRRSIENSEKQKRGAAIRL